MCPSIDSPLAVIRSAVAPLRGARILDVGCGEGGLARLLAAEGALVMGVDPNLEAVARARELIPGARIEQATAEALPFENDEFDTVVVVNALHHVPLAAMDKVLGEAARVTRPGGTLIVIEPLAEGSFFAALRMVEDETAIRLAAQQALTRAIASGLLKLTTTVTYIRREIFDDAGRFLDRIIAVDPAREAVVRANHDAIAAAVVAAATRTKDGKLILYQPIKADILVPMQR